MKYFYLKIVIKQLVKSIYINIRVYTYIYIKYFYVILA